MLCNVILLPYKIRLCNALLLWPSLVLLPLGSGLCQS